MLKIAHIVNPVAVGKDSDLYLAQPVTFETMRMARDFATGIAKVELLATMYPEDHAIEPEQFNITRDLQKEVYNSGSFNEYRKLPLISEIIDNLSDTEADYYIYTNVDIALKPYFYHTVSRYIESGLKAFVINRRTISGNYNSASELPLMLAEVGENHPGYDCFVFHKSLIGNFNFGTACIGANWIGRVIITNLLAQTEDFKVFETPDLTFHIGDDRSWKTVRFEDYDKHNESELLKIIDHFKSMESCQNLNWINSFESYHIKNIRSREANKKINFDERHLSPVFDSSQESGTMPRITQNPIFVVGHPRSGTTLIQALIGTQKRVLPTYETHYFDIILKHFNYTNGLLLYDADELLILIRKYSPLSHRTKAFIETNSETGVDIKVLFEMIIEDNLKYIHKTDALSDIRWIEKTPDHVFSLNKIKELYPEAKFINVLRSPERVILSRKRVFLWNNEEKWEIERHARLWVDSVNSADNFEKNNQEYIKTVRLEDVVDKKHKTIRGICRFLNIRYSRIAVKKHGRIAAKIIHPWESWKMNAKASVSAQAAQKPNNSLSGVDLLLLSYYTKKQCEKHNYHINISGNQNTGKEVHALFVKNDEFSSKINKLSTRLEIIESKNNSFYNQLIEKQSQVVIKNEEVQKLLRIIEEKTYWLEIFQKRLDEKTLHVEKLKSLLEKNQGDKATLCRELDEEYKKFDSDFTEMNQQLRAFSNKNAVLDEELTKLKAANGSLAAESTNKDNEIEKLRKRTLELETEIRRAFYSAKKIHK